MHVFTLITVCRSMIPFFFFLMIRRPPRSTLFPYTTLGKRFFSGVSGSCLPARARLANDKRGRRGFRVRVAWAVVPRKRGGFFGEGSIASSKRSGEGRGGEEGRFRGAPYYLKKKKKKMRVEVICQIINNCKHVKYELYRSKK